jgi:hypothetical protein
MPYPLEDQVYVDDNGISHRYGDHVYSYYLMVPGTIGPDLGDGWFDFVHTYGAKVTMLNGQRICSIEHAKRMGWPTTREEILKITVI